MSFNYRTVGRQKPGDPASPVKYYVSPVYGGYVTHRQLAKKIADISTVSPIDTLAVLEALLMLLPEELIEGRIVKLGDFGTFRMTLRSEGADSEDAVSAAQIKKAVPYFRPSAVFSDIANKVKFVKAD